VGLSTVAGIAAAYPFGWTFWSRGQFTAFWRDDTTATMANAYRFELQAGECYAARTNDEENPNSFFEG
jgi:hypothetical protein